MNAVYKVYGINALTQEHALVTTKDNLEEAETIIADFRKTYPQITWWLLISNILEKTLDSPEIL